MAEMTRRAFMRLVAGGGATLAFGSKRTDTLFSPVTPPRDARPDVWSQYATTCRECPAGCGMHLWHRTGRVTKAEGNPGHPLNRGGLCPRGQSSVQGLYDPDRVRTVLKGRGVLSAGTWESALRDIGERLGRGGRVAVLSGLETGPMAGLLRRFAEVFATGGAEPRFLLYEPFSYEPLKAVHGELFGRPVVPAYRLDGCGSILSFSADFLEGWISNVEFARRFSDTRNLRNGSFGHFAYVGPRLSMTAANADEFVQVPGGMEGAAAMAVLGVMLEKGWVRGDAGPLRDMVRDYNFTALDIPGLPRDRTERIAREFFDADRSVALAGPQGASGGAARALATAVALLNVAAGRVGQTMDLARPHALSAVAGEEDVRRFLSGLTPNDVLVIHNANPAYARGDAADWIGRAGLVVCLATMLDETARLADYVLPIDSPLESWGEYEPYPGIIGLMQPTMARLHDTRHAGDILLALAEVAGRPLVAGPNGPAASFQDILARRWELLAGGQGVDAGRFWRDALQRGGSWPGPDQAGSQAGQAPPMRPARPALPQPIKARGTELWAWAPVMLHDGRVSNRSWLQENPEPVSYIAWGSWVDIHPDLAASLGVGEGDMVVLENSLGMVQAPARITAEVAPNVAALGYGQGHTALGRNALRGANAFRLMGADAQGETMFGPVRLRRASGSQRLAYATGSRDQHDREVLRWMGRAEAARLKPGEGEPLIMPLPEGYDPRRDLYAPHEHKDHRWAMAVDLQRCIGCGACAVACYAENNIPVRGEQEVHFRRGQPWLKIVPYRHPDDPMRLAWLPALCQHCDAAPCEPVCPVYAAVHNEEGLNAQIYNRCVGTRYCANNCPYKVRRFNWKNTVWEKPLDWQLNPEVTVRSRGVMEKCTFCVQRIRAAEYQARIEDRKVRDGEILPACVQSCPAGVYTFGDLLDPNAAVTRLIRQEPRRYQLLAELNTKPAVIYLRRILRSG